MANIPAAEWPELHLDLAPACRLVTSDFPILSTTVNGRALVYLDNAATAQSPTQVVDALASADGDIASIARHASSPSPAHCL